jgi:hypothetical protein
MDLPGLGHGNMRESESKGDTSATSTRWRSPVRSWLPSTPVRERGTPQSGQSPCPAWPMAQPPCCSGETWRSGEETAGARATTSFRCAEPGEGEEREKIHDPRPV